MSPSRTKLSQQVVEEVRKHFEALTYQTEIPRTVRLGEAPSFGKTILEYDPSGVGARAYRQFTEEFILRQRGETFGRPDAPLPPVEEPAPALEIPQTLKEGAA